MSRPLRFLHLTTFYPPYSFGGDGLYVQRLAHALGDDGHSVDVVHCIDSYRLLKRNARPLPCGRHPNVSAIGLRSALGWLSPLASHQSGRPLLKRAAISRVMADKRYDVVHYHNISLFGPGVLGLETGAAVKLYTAHEHWLICPTHVLWKFNSRPCERAQCLRCTLMSRRPPQLWRYTGLLTRAAAHVDRFLAPSHFTATMHAERGFAGTFTLFPNFADRVDRDWQEPGPRPHGRPYFLFVGRLEVIKGVQTLFESMKRVAEADLLIAGDGADAARLRSLARGNPRIRFLGACSPAELGPLYYHALACLVPSLTFEPFPTVMIEAFSRKTPVIARDLGGLPEVVDASRGGVVYRTDDELVEAMRCMLAPDGPRRELGESGYRAFVDRWSKEAHLARYYKLLEEVTLEKLGRLPWRETSRPDGMAVAGRTEA